MIEQSLFVFPGKGGNDVMIKLRIMGLPNDLKWFEKLLKRHRKVKVDNISERLPTLTDPAGMIVKRVKQELDTTTPKRGKNK